MSRIDLDVYYRNLFNNVNNEHEEFKLINAAHVISSNYYDIQFNRTSIIYRDKFSKIVIPVEHELNNKIVVYFDHYKKSIKLDNIDILKKRISAVFDFLKIKYSIE